MASASRSSSTSAMVTYPRRNSNYDVFVSFRGEDTRNNFTDFLFEAFQTKGIFVFRDDNNLPKGESIGPELLNAIQHSHIFVVVFSTNYASSTWCLQELDKICECVQVSGKHVLPVFYDVDPSEVRHQKGIYAEAFSKHEHRFQHDSQMVSRWREALTQVANLSGWDLRDKPQSAAVKEIVQKVINILDCKSSCVSKDLVGMDSPIQELEKLLLLNSVHDVRVVGICGMGGIGKTTLATVLYDRISQYFGACCFIDDVSKIYRLHDGPLGAQKQILDQTLGQEHHQICNHYNATNLIRRSLCRQRALIILDNVGQVEQLEKMAVYRECLGAGSRIIIISRDEHILKQYGVDAVYQVPLLNWNNSLQLLCRKAFKLDHILNSYEGLVNGILHYADGLPLAIKVLGSFLYGRDVSEWRSALERLRESPDKDVMDVLRLSFDDLRETEKEIFLHIACFFNSCPEKYVKNVLNCCGFHVDIGLRVLIDKSLVSIDKSLVSIELGWIVMHNLLEELGRNIVAENTSKEPRKWRRLWFHEQLYDVMLENMENKVEAVVLARSLGEDYEDMDAVILEDFSNLRLLIFKYVKVSGSLNHLSNKLRYIEWLEYPFMYLPSSFQPNQLVELILEYSSIEQLWEGKKNLPKLRFLDLSYSENLIKMPHFGEFPNLERLNLEGCNKLVQLDPSIGLLRKIVYLNLKYCTSLVSIPNIFGLSSLIVLKMHGCSGCCFKKIKNTRHLHTRLCKWTTKSYHSLLPTPTTNTVMVPSLLSIYCLREVDISCCGLSQVPEAIGCLRWLEMLNLGGNNFVTLPSLRELSKLVYLNLENCECLESLPELPFPTTIEQDLRKKKYRGRTGLIIFNCPKISDEERCSRMTFSWMTQFIQVNKEYPAFFYLGIVIPGSEIPSWFNNQSVGCSLPVSPYMHDNGNNVAGFLCCAVFSVSPYPIVSLKLYADVDNNSLSFPVIVHRKHITVKSNNIWLMYFPWESNHIYNFRFHVGSMDAEVMKCGYRWVYEQDLQEFNLTTMHPGNMLALNHKFWEIEDEAQPQPQLHSFI